MAFPGPLSGSGTMTAPGVQERYWLSTSSVLLATPPTSLTLSNCGFSGTQSCYASGEISVVRTGIAGHPGSFTSMPSLGDPAPNLLVGVNELVKELDLDSL